MRFDENLLRERNEWKSVSEAPGLPFQSYAQIQNAIANRSYTLDVSYPAARELAPVVRSYGGRFLNLLFAFIPLLTIIAIVSLALWQGRYVLLVGVPIVLIAHVFSHPMNPLRQPMTWLNYISDSCDDCSLESNRDSLAGCVHFSVCGKPRNVCGEREGFARGASTIRASIPAPTFQGGFQDAAYHGRLEYEIVTRRRTY